MEERQTKICPFCGKEILIRARKCKYCGNWLDVNNPEPSHQPEIEQTKLDINLKHTQSDMQNQTTKQSFLIDQGKAKIRRSQILQLQRMQD